MWKKIVKFLKWAGVVIGSIIFALALLAGLATFDSALNNPKEKGMSIEYKEGYVQAIHDMKNNKAKVVSLPSEATYVYRETLDGKVLSDTITVR